MSQTKATLEEVRKAFDTLLSMGRTPALANIVALTKGSRSTVAKHVRTVRAEKANAAPDPGAPLTLLQSLSEPLVLQVWAEAQKLASGAYEQHLRSLQTIQAGLSQDLEDLLASEETAVERAEAAEARLVDLERQLQVHTDFEAQLGSLKQIVEQMGCFAAGQCHSSSARATGGADHSAGDPGEQKTA